MPKPYSADLRERVLLAGEAGLPPAIVARHFGVGLSTVYLWRQQARAEGRRCAKPHVGGRTLGMPVLAGSGLPMYFPSAFRFERISISGNGFVGSRSHDAGP